MSNIKPEKDKPVKYRDMQQKLLNVAQGSKEGKQKRTQENSKHHNKQEELWKPLFYTDTLNIGSVLRLQNIGPQSLCSSGFFVFVFFVSAKSTRSFRDLYLRRGFFLAALQESSYWQAAAVMAAHLELSAICAQDLEFHQSSHWLLHHISNLDQFGQTVSCRKSPDCAQQMCVLVCVSSCISLNVFLI